MRAVIAVGVAILGAEVFTEILLQAQPPKDPFWEWLITLIATVLAALFAVSVFEYQSRQAERDRQNKLLAAVAAELQSNLIIRSGHRTPFLTRHRFRERKGATLDTRTQS
jgi:peptidoglycan/LPS O-acetylase OafA/YrhL